VKKLDQLSTGFLYAVSSSSTTGSDKQMLSVTKYLKTLGGYGLKNPVLVGFGIKDKKTFKEASADSRGAIIGSAYIKALSAAADVKIATRDFLKSVLG